MADKQDHQKDFSTCFEKLPFAEMMRKMLGRQGVGSICSEMMAKIMKRQEGGHSFPCAEMMKKMKKECAGFQEQTKKSKKEVGHERK
jgi:hypothetical protein